MDGTLEAGRPLIQRNALWGRIPQYPDWFSTRPQLRARDRLLRKIRTQEYRFEEVPLCTLCGSQASVLIGDQERHGVPFSAVLCTDCGLARTSPRLTAESLRDHYRADSQLLKRGDRAGLGADLFESQKNKGRRVAVFLDGTGSPLAAKRRFGMVVEVGSAEGGALSILRERADRVVGLELNFESVEFGRSQGLEMHAVTLSEFKDAASCDLFIYEQTLEHIPDLHSELRELAVRQKLGSLLYVGVPGMRNIEAHYGSNLMAYFEFQHMHHFTLKTLARLLGGYGYRLVSGNEDVQALFIKDSDQPLGQSLLPREDVPSLLEFLRGQESRYRASGAKPWKGILKFLCKQQSERLMSWVRPSG
jgi:hypothetical protein